MKYFDELLNFLAAEPTVGLAAAKIVHGYAAEDPAAAEKMNSVLILFFT